MNDGLERVTPATGYAAPLHGIRVVDFGQWMAGPAAGKMLADNGADVVHVDLPDGPRWHVEAAENLNRTKRRVRLNLRDAEDLEQAALLVREADVVIENFAPGTMSGLGLDYGSVRAANPGVVYLSLPGFASTDEDHPRVQAYEGVIATATGQFADMGVNRRLMGVEASYSPLPLASSYASLFGALAVALALRARARHGHGEHVEVPVASALLEGLSYNALDVQNLPRRYLSRREREIERREHAGIPMGIDYEGLTELLDPFYRAYWCSDGRPFYVVAVGHRRHPRRVLEILGIYDEAVAAGVPMFDPYLPAAQWPDDCTIYAHPITDGWAGWLSSRITTAIATRTSQEWELIFAEHNIPGISHRTTQEWLSLPHVLESGLMVEVGDPSGPTKRPGPVAWLESVPTVSPVTAPVTAPDALPAGGWLDGVTVVDLTNVIAGPTIASTLARFGARVIKVDPPQPPFDPWNAVLCGLHSNRGKHSVLLDARTPGGSAALRELIATADLVTMNASTRQVAALGLTPAELAQFAPKTILCQLDAWSGPVGGPWRERSGYDDLVQAAAGIAARFGGGLRTPEEHAHFGTIDVLAGLAGALAAALALYARETTGEVFTARTSLAAAGQLLQTPFLYDREQRGPWDEPSGPTARGESPLYRFYRASDTWMFIVIPDGVKLSDVAGALGHQLDGLDGSDLSDALAEAFAGQPAGHWSATLAELGASAQPLEKIARLRSAGTDSSPTPWTASSFHFNHAPEHPCGHGVTLVSPVAIRPALAAIVVPTDAPKYGRDTRTVLAEIGYGAAAIDELIRDGAAGESWSELYLPD